MAGAVVDISRPASSQVSPTVTRLIQAAYLVTGLVGFKFGFDFGEQVSGAMLGAFTGLSTAVFAVLLASAVAGWLVRRKPGRGSDD